jgi:predicted DsbA family dithiol-disulfide isomerase
MGLNDGMVRLSCGIEDAGDLIDDLDRALEGKPDHPFTIEWHPFQLNPDMPSEGADRATYLEARFGGRDKAVAIYARVEQAARDLAAGRKDTSRANETDQAYHRLLTDETKPE